MNALAPSGLDYVFGLARNERLIGAIADKLAEAEAGTRSSKNCQEPNRAKRCAGDLDLRAKKRAGDR